MKHYGMSYWDVLKLPLRTFWSLNRQIDRLRAEDDQRSLRIANASQSAEAAKELAEMLRLELDAPVVIEKKFDAAKFDELAARFRGEVA